MTKQEFDTNITTWEEVMQCVNDFKLYPDSGYYPVSYDDVVDTINAQAIKLRAKVIAYDDFVAFADALPRINNNVFEVFLASTGDSTLFALPGDGYLEEYIEAVFEAMEDRGYIVDDDDEDEESADSGKPYEIHCNGSVYKYVSSLDKAFRIKLMPKGEPAPITPTTQPPPQPTPQPQQTYHPQPVGNYSPFDGNIWAKKEEEKPSLESLGLGDIQFA